MIRQVQRCDSIVGVQVNVDSIGILHIVLHPVSGVKAENLRVRHLGLVTVDVGHSIASLQKLAEGQVLPQFFEEGLGLHELVLKVARHDVQVFDLVQLSKDQVPKVGLAEYVAREILNGFLELIKGQIVEAS